MNKKLKVAALISGRGSNLQALIDACKAADYPAEIVAVISNKADAKGLERAKEAGIKTYTINHKEFDSREAFDEKLHEVIISSGAEFVCLAGFMRILSSGFVKKWEGKMINIHPSLLPAFKGHNAHEQAIETGVKISGCTVHFVVPEMDSGPIILQSPVPVFENDTPETLAARVLEAEHTIYPIALRLIAEGRVRIVGNKAVPA